MQIEAGMVLSGKVTAITTFGAFVELSDNRTGLIHISEIAAEYVENVSDYLKRGQVVNVKVIGTDNGKISLSLKQLDSDSAMQNAKPKEKQENKLSKREKRNMNRAVQPRNTNPPEEFEFKRKSAPGEMSFDDMLQKFKRDSDEKFQDLKRSNDNKRSGGYKRAY